MSALDQVDVQRIVREEQERALRQQAVRERRERNRQRYFEEERLRQEIRKRFAAGVSVAAPAPASEAISGTERSSQAQLERIRRSAVTAEDAATAERILTVAARVQPDLVLRASPAAPEDLVGHGIPDPDRAVAIRVLRNYALASGEVHDAADAAP